MRLDRGQIEVVDSAQALILRGKTPAERLQMAVDMWEFCRRVLTTYLEQSHPEWNEEAVRREVSRRLFHGAV
ncbi:MAG: hypothetical protein HY671_03525 [Chloroflexi bacterium]|nr:hypothetical protein [Chloroflexota bacterium]